VWRAPSARDVSDPDDDGWLAARGPTLVVLDNAESRLGAVRERVARWTVTAPRLRVLVTTREALGLPDERALDVLPLDAASAAELFASRASALPPELADATLVHRIVARLEGLPLAVELAAARTEVLSPAQILERLDARFDLLRGVGKKGRHASLEEALFASWDALDDDERAALVRLAAFEGPFTVEDAESVVGELPARATVLDVLQALRRKSLVRAALTRPTQELWLGLDENVRAFALARAEGEGASELVAARARHVVRFHAHAVALAADEHGPKERTSFARLEAVTPNVLAAFDAAEHASPVVAAELALSLHAARQVRGPSDDHLRLLDRAVACLEGLEVRPSREARAAGAPPLAAVLRARGEARRVRGRVAEAEADLGRALEVAGSAFPREAAEAERLLGVLARSQARFAEAASRSASALERFRKLGDAVREAVSLSDLAMVRHRLGHGDEAEARAEEALATFRRVGARRAEGVELDRLGTYALDGGRPRDALDLHASALAIHREVGNERFCGATLAGLGESLLELGDLPAAEARFREALEVAERVGERLLEAACGTFLGEVLLAQGAPDAVEVLERALRTHRQLGARAYEARTLEALGDALASRGAEGDAARAARLRVEAETTYAAIGVTARGRREAGSGGSVPPAAAPAFRIGVSDDGRLLVAPDGTRHDLSRQRSARLILLCLVDAHRETPNVGLSWERLLEAGWPGERVSVEAAFSRVRTAVLTLRKRGLRGVLATRDDGYLLDPRLVVDAGS
jgi:predicted ATPase